MKKRKRQRGHSKRPSPTLRAVRIWKIKQLDGMRLRVATIEQGPRKESMCDGCAAPCCKGLLQPALNEEEFTTRKFPFQYVPVPDWLREKIPPPGADALAVLKVDEDGCVFHDARTNLCMAWPHCPDSCKAYDCREDDREPIAMFAKARMKELSQRNGRVSRN